MFIYPFRQNFKWVTENINWRERMDRTVKQKQEQIFKLWNGGDFFRSAFKSNRRKFQQGAGSGTLSGSKEAIGKGWCCCDGHSQAKKKKKRGDLGPTWLLEAFWLKWYQKANLHLKKKKKRRLLLVINSSKLSICSTNIYWGLAKF